jgi:uracil-DNA glycosylase family 4
MLVGEAPGQKEDEGDAKMGLKAGIPFQGPAGRELNRFLSKAGLSRESVYVHNVLGCRPPGNLMSPAIQEHIGTCTSLWLEPELEIVRPEVVIAVGATAINHFLKGKLQPPFINLDGSISVDTVNGLPFFPAETGRPFVVFCTYHTAAGLRNEATMHLIEEAFQNLSLFLGGSTVRQFDEHPEPSYRWVSEGERLPGVDFYHLMTRRASTVALDFEIEPDGSMFCWSMSTEAGTGSAFEPGPINNATLRAICEDPAIVKVFHNLPGVDWAVLAKLGIESVNYQDTMVRAYLLNFRPQGLKALAAKRLGMAMEEYGHIVRAHRQPVAMAYVKQIEAEEWPFEGRNRPMESRARTMLKKAGLEIIRPKPRKPPKPRIKKDGTASLRTQKPIAPVQFNEIPPVEGFDLWSAWRAVRLEDRAFVEEVFGPLLDVGLKAEWEVNPQHVVVYSSRDADATLRLYQLQEPHLKVAGMTGPGRVLELDTESIGPAAEMMARGMGVDVPRLIAFGELCRQRVSEATQKCTDLTGLDFNPLSSDQVARVLYEDLKLPTPDKSLRPGQKHFTTDEEYLAKLFDRTKHPVISAILDARGWDKLRGTYAESLPRQAVKGRVHPELRLTRTETGRPASANPNLQNQPVRTKEGKEIRQAFVASPGRVLLSCDQSQIELRITAHLSDDSVMIERFIKGWDIHRATAAEAYGVPLDLVTPEQRQIAKIFNFGVIYGMSEDGLATAVNDSYMEAARETGESVDPAKLWLPDRAAEFIRVYFDIYRGVRRWINDIQQFVLDHGYVADIAGRRRYIPQALSTNRRSSSKALREASNMPVQSSSQVALRRPMARVYRELRQLGLSGLGPGGTISPADPVWMIMQVHDELILEPTTETWEVVARMTKVAMETSLVLKVPMLAEVKVGDRWGSMKKVEIGSA